jgi:hypothetical protein
MAKIECKIKRAGGSKIDIGGVDYHFKPTSDAEGAPHVCEVKDEEHIARFLEIRDGYKLVGAAEKQPAPDTDAGGGDGNDEEDTSRMVIKNGDESIDLMELGKGKLVAFAKDAGFEIDKTANAQAIREQIYKQAKG